MLKATTAAAKADPRAPKIAITLLGSYDGILAGCLGDRLKFTLLYLDLCPLADRSFGVLALAGFGFRQLRV